MRPPCVHHASAMRPPCVCHASAMRWRASAESMKNACNMPGMDPCICHALGNLQENAWKKHAICLEWTMHPPCICHASSRSHGIRMQQLHALSMHSDSNACKRLAPNCFSDSKSNAWIAAKSMRFPCVMHGMCSMHSPCIRQAFSMHYFSKGKCRIQTFKSRLPSLASLSSPDTRS